MRARAFCIFRRHGEVPGDFVQNLYEGSGQLYADDGTLIYEGGFKAGLYDGDGQLYEEGELIYKEVSKGKRSGEGESYKDGEVWEKGTFADDELVTGTTTIYGEDENRFILEVL